jgi:hypothetical protein
LIGDKAWTGDAAWTPEGGFLPYAQMSDNGTTAICLAIFGEVSALAPGIPCGLYTGGSGHLPLLFG